ncbi:hypothetical protein ACLRGI_19535 [Paenarthrobacter nitroguajacolicus]|uniref:hypothetical protein n=1 Tax=Paenarthrobacter nitroguajacolicus TaxID=211146 RepID=UPI003AE6D910
MMLLKTLNFFLDASGSNNGPSSESNVGHSPAIATDRLTSSAWEGWWDDADQGFPADA